MTTAPGGSRHRHERKTGPMNDEYPTTENETQPELQPFDPRDGDDFNTEQRRIDDWASASSGYVGEVIATTSIQGVRAGIDMARRVALEHENRAVGARRVEQRLREELADAAQHGYQSEDDPDEPETGLATAVQGASVREANSRLSAEREAARSRLMSADDDVQRPERDLPVGGF